MKRPPYEDMARRLGYDYCRGILPSGHYCPLDHDKGTVTNDGVTGTVHWSERPRTPPKIRHFLLLLATERVTGLSGWRQSWGRIIWVNDAMRLLHIRLPRSTWAHEAATLYAQATAADPSKSRDEALVWARQHLEGVV